MMELPNINSEPKTANVLTLYNHPQFIFFFDNVFLLAIEAKLPNAAVLFSRLT